MKVKCDHCQHEADYVPEVIANNGNRANCEHCGIRIYFKWGTDAHDLIGTVVDARALCALPHHCSCGGHPDTHRVDHKPHVVSENGCFREMCAAPIPAPARNGMKFFWPDGNDDSKRGPITEYTLKHQRGYHQHPCNCWSRTKHINR